jgi:hypothetical protein
MVDELPERKRSEHSLLKEMAEMIRNAYIDARHVWDVSRGGKRECNPDDKWNEAWLKTAKFMLKNEVLDYLEYIQLQFAHRQTALAPQPNQLYGQAAFNRWKKHSQSLESQCEVVREALAFQKHRFRVELTQARAWSPVPNDPEAPVVFVILDDSNQLSPLFRLCFATECKRLDLANQYRDAAMLQYLFGRRAYDLEWKDLLPTAFCQDAESIRSMFLSNFATKG